MPGCGMTPDPSAALNGSLSIRTQKPVAGRQQCDESMAVAVSCDSDLHALEVCDTSSFTTATDQLRSFEFGHNHRQKGRIQEGSCNPDQQLLARMGADTACTCAIGATYPSDRQEAVWEREDRLLDGFCAPLQASSNSRLINAQP